MERMEFDGRVLEVVDPFAGTIEHELYTEGVLSRHGLDKVEIEKGETSDAFARRLLEEVIRDGRIFPVLACFMTFEGQSWSPKGAPEVEAFLRDVRAPEGKALIRASVVSLLIGFFSRGLASLVISRSSLIGGLGGAKDQPAS